jgi:hypothetical protein
VSSCWAPSSIPGKSIWVLWWTKGNFKRVSSYSYSFPPSHIISQTFHKPTHLQLSLLLPEWQNLGSLVINKKSPFGCREALHRNVLSYFNYNVIFSFKTIIRTKGFLTRPSVFYDKYWLLKNVWNFCEKHVRFLPRNLLKKVQVLKTST